MFFHHSVLGTKQEFYNQSVLGTKQELVLQSECKEQIRSNVIASECSGNKAGVMLFHQSVLGTKQELVLQSQCFGNKAGIISSVWEGRELLGVIRSTILFE